MALWLD